KREKDREVKKVVFAATQAITNSSNNSPLENHGSRTSHVCCHRNRHDVKKMHVASSKAFASEEKMTGNSSDSSRHMVPIVFVNKWCNCGQMLLRSA
ncbi:hypothetical protein C0J52_26080, partial [Blattella germanica]